MACKCRVERGSRSGGRWEDVRRGIQGGCSRCAFIDQCIRLAPFGTQEVDGILVKHGDYCEVLTKKLYKDVTRVDVFTTDGQEENPLQLKQIAAHLPGSTSSETTFRTIKGWLNECTSSHKSCHKNGEQGHEQQASPKRLLKISKDQVVLWENIGQQRYACLSYCWGDSAHIAKTTKETIEDHQRDIPWDQLNATFQDAITVCRRLDISYLWVDALCITQDSEADWTEQAAQMASIYANAYFTIAATNSGDASGGCFRNTSDKYMSKLLPGYKDTYIRHKLPKFPYYMSNEYELGNSPEWPLFHRGWAYQEMRLSPRVLHFCAEEVVWVCRDYQKSESMDNDQTLAYDDEWDKTGYPYTPYGILEKHPRYLWYRTVAEYSRLRLSRGDDKMAALSGLAKRMQDLRLGDRYMVGLWEKTLLLDLLWNVRVYHSASKSRIARYPTWSWASSPYQVEWESGTQGINIPLDCTRVEDIKLTNRGPSHMADCVEGKITLIAPLLNASSLLTACQAREVASLESGSTARPQPFDHLYPEPYDTVITNLDHLYVSLYRPDDGSFIQDVTSTGLCGYLIPLAAGYEFSPDIDAIHVQKEQSSGYYRRVGRATLSHAATTSYKQWNEFRNRYEENTSTVRRLIKDLPTQRITLI